LSGEGGGVICGSWEKVLARFSRTDV
jgi:hypothetical protein